MNPITAVERAIDFLGNKLLRPNEGRWTECDAPGSSSESASRGSTEQGNDAGLGPASLLRRIPGAAYAAFRAALSSDYDATRDPLWIRLLSCRPRLHDAGWYPRESRRHRGEEPDPISCDADAVTDYLTRHRKETK